MLIHSSAHRVAWVSAATLIALVLLVEVAGFGHGWSRVVQILLTAGATGLAAVGWSYWQRELDQAAYDAAMDAEDERRENGRSRSVTSTRLVSLEGCAAPASPKPRRAWGSPLVRWVGGCAAVAALITVVVSSLVAAGESDRGRRVAPVSEQLPAPIRHLVEDRADRDLGYRVTVGRGSTAEAPQEVPTAPAPAGEVESSPTPAVSDAHEAPPSVGGQSAGSEPAPAEVEQHPQQASPPEATPSSAPPQAPAAPSPAPTTTEGCKIEIKQNGAAINGCTGMEIELGM